MELANDIPVGTGPIKYFLEEELTSIRNAIKETQEGGFFFKFSVRSFFMLSSSGQDCF
jgi:hypothetical protein